MKDYYTTKFYEDILAGSRRSAEAVLPIILAEIKPQSIVDVGCGTGTWLLAAKKLNVPVVLGLDGDYASRDLQIEPSEFKATDLREGFLLDARYDLALCLEVGEHILPQESSILVNCLTKAADIILFSAAIPGQGGVHHVNEQWPEFWQRLFQDADFVCIDWIRPIIYNNPEVEWWYRQNMFLYGSRKILMKYPRLEAEANKNQANDILLLHRSLLKKRYGLMNSLRYYLKLPVARVVNKLGFSK